MPDTARALTLMSRRRDPRPTRPSNGRDATVGSLYLRHRRRQPAAHDRRATGRGRPARLGRHAHPVALPWPHRSL